MKLGVCDNEYPWLCTGTCAGTGPGTGTDPVPVTGGSPGAGGRVKITGRCRYRLTHKMSLGDTFLPCPHLFPGAGHVGQRLLPGAPQAEIFVSSRTTASPITLKRCSRSDRHDQTTSDWIKDGRAVFHGDGRETHYFVREPVPIRGRPHAMSGISPWVWL